MKLYIAVLLTVIGFVGYSQSSQQVTLSKLLEIQDTTNIEAEILIYDLGFEYRPMENEKGLDVYYYRKFSPSSGYSSILKDIYEGVNVKTTYMTYDRNDYNRLMKELKESDFQYDQTIRNDKYLAHRYEKGLLEISIGLTHSEEDNKNLYIITVTDQVNKILYESFSKLLNEKKE